MAKNIKRKNAREATDILNGASVLDAYTKIKDVCTKTEVRELDWLSKICDQKVLGKFENQQRTGSFKFRGAYYRVKYRVEQKPIIVASAGNHGLAIAEVGKILNVKTTICIPTTASPLKKERLSAYGHSIIQQGASLDESIAYAKNLAEKFDWDFISPYNDTSLIAGQGTVAVEFLDQYHNIDTLIIPTGGGGLLAGVALAAKRINSGIRIIGVSPEKYPSFSLSFNEGGSRKVPNYPTFADGLAVNVEEGSVTLDLAKNFIETIVLVSEEEIAAATLALLYHESQLIEPSGAVGLAAIISGKLSMQKLGTVGLIFTGSNVSTANLHKIINYPFTDTSLFDFINIRGSKVQYQNALKGVSFSSRRNTDNFATVSQQNDTPASVDKQRVDEEQDNIYWQSRCEHIDNLLTNLTSRLTEYVRYCEVEKIQMDTAAVETFETAIINIRQDFNRMLIGNIPPNISPSIYNQQITKRLQQYRALLHEILSASLVLDWRSASYGQSWDSMFFHVDSQGNPGVNYNRYESNQLATVEKVLAEILGLNMEESALFATSSGMAAYSLLESYLIRHVLKAGDKIYIPSYIYFETEEQVEKLPHVKIIRTETHDTNTIAANILRERPRVVFIDPLTNTVELRMTDIEGVLKSIADKITDDVWFVIDGTMISGQLDIEVLSSINSHIKILYYDSCSKYLQLGLDIAMGGLVVVPVQLQSFFERLRRNTGTIMYDSAANIFPIYNRSVHQTRMKRFSRNARLVGELVESDSDLKSKITPNFPGLEVHPDHPISKTFESVGGLITFSFIDPYLNQRDSLNSFIETALAVAKKHKISLTKGVSFGFSIPRISAATAMAENSPPFLRLSVGDRSYVETEKLAEVLIEAFKIYIANATRFNE